MSIAHSSAPENEQWQAKPSASQQLLSKKEENAYFNPSTVGFFLEDPIPFDPYSQTKNDSFGESDLIKAMKCGDKRRFQEIYKAEASMSRVNSFMATVFLNGEAFHAQLKKPEFALLKDSSGKTLLHYAAVGGVNLNEGYFKNFVLPRTVGEQDSRGVTALMLAALNGRFEQVKILKNFELSIQDIEGRTALMYAARNSRFDIVKELLQECYIEDRNGFLFLDYFPKSVPQAYIEELELKLRGKLSEYQTKRITEENTEIKEELEETPPFEELNIQFREEISKMVANIEKRVVECEEIEKETTEQPIIRLCDEFRVYLCERVFPKLQNELAIYIKKEEILLENSAQINKETAEIKTNELFEFYQNLKDNLEVEEQNLTDFFKISIEKIHLLLLYKENDIHDDFDVIFEEFQEAEESRNMQLKECVKILNNLAFKNLKFQRARDECIEIATNFQNFGDELYEECELKFKNALSDAHELLDSEIAKEIELLCTEFTQEQSLNVENLKEEIFNKTMLKIDENVLIRINEAMAKKEAFAMSEFPDVVTLKNNISCISTMIRKSEKLITYEYYSNLAQLSNYFIQNEAGLFEFIGDNEILPLLNNIPNYTFLEEYFEVFHKEYKFSKEELIQGMINEFVTQFSPMTEKQFVLFCRKFYYAEKSDNIPELVCERYGTLKKQKINILDSLGEDIEVGFAYFYTSILLLMNKCEIIQYSEIYNIEYEELVSENQYLGTYRMFEPTQGKKYQCVSPGWIYLNGKNEIDIIVEPQFEELECI